MNDREKLIFELRQHHCCITHGEDCGACEEVNYRTCRHHQELFKRAADMLEAAVIPQTPGGGCSLVQGEPSTHTHRRRGSG